MIWIPTSFHIELTNACVARCPFCIRTKENTQYSSELYHEDIINFFTPELLKSTTDVTLCGTYGDPIYARDIVDIVHYFVSHDVKVHISTNGYIKKEGLWKSLAKKGVFITFGIDGVTQKQHERYRVNTNLKVILKNAKAYIDHGGWAMWQFLIFDYNENQIEIARSISQRLGFKDFMIRRSREYGKNHGKPLRSYHKEGEKLKWLDFICTNREKKEWYINAQGQVLPCCYLSSLQHWDASLSDIKMCIKSSSYADILRHSIWGDKVGYFKDKSGKNRCEEACGEKGGTHKVFTESNIQSYVR